MSPSLAPTSLLRDEFDESPWYGYIVLQSDRLIVLQRVSDQYGLDGYCAFDREDISQITQEFDRADLISRAIRLKAQSPAVPKGIDASSMRDLTESIGREYGVLIINRERVAPNEAEVGTIRMSSSQTYVLRWLNTEASWSPDERTFRYKDITYVEFGGEYETTLLQVARDREHEGDA